MLQKIAEKKRILLIVMVVLLVAAGVFFEKTSRFGFTAALKTCLFALVLAALYLIVVCGPRRILKWVWAHKNRLIHVLFLETGLLFYMYYFVHKIKDVVTLYHSAQMSFGFIAMLLIAVTAVLTEIGKIPLQRIYLFAGVSLGIMFLFMQPVGSIPDEKAHLFVSYDVSNTLMGISRTEDGNLLMRADDAEFELLDEAGGEEFSLYWEALDDKAVNEEMQDIGRRPINAQKYQYIMPGIGLTIGRLFHLGAAGTFFLGRLFNMLGFVLITAYAIRCLPFGKSILALLALMPMSLQQASSFSYDAFVNSAAFLLVAMTLRLAYGKENWAESTKGKRWHAVHMIILLAACILLLPIKGYAYAPICFLPVILVFSNWKTNRKEALLYLGILAACVAAFAIMRLLPMMHQIETVTYMTSRSNKVKEMYSLAYLRSHPYEWVYVLLNDSRNHRAFYIESMLVTPLAKLTKPVNNVMVYVCTSVLLLASLRKKDETAIPGKAAKLWIHLTSWISVACVLLGMLFVYTPVEHKLIDGVQGRYFIPLVFPMLLTVRSARISADRSIDGPLLSAVLTCAFFVVHYLIT